MSFSQQLLIAYTALYEWGLLNFLYPCCFIDWCGLFTYCETCCWVLVSATPLLYLVDNISEKIPYFYGLYKLPVPLHGCFWDLCVDFSLQIYHLVLDIPQQFILCILTSINLCNSLHLLKKMVRGLELNLP